MTVTADVGDPRDKQANPYAFLAKKAQPRLEFPGTVENKKLREKNIV